MCFRINPADADLDEAALEQINRTVLARIFWEDRAFLSSTLLHKTFALRLCIVNHSTTWDDVRETARLGFGAGGLLVGTAEVGMGKALDRLLPDGSGSF